MCMFFFLFNNLKVNKESCSNQSNSHCNEGNDFHKLFLLSAFSDYHDNIISQIVFEGIEE
jgi:hypothetical protein